MFEKDVTSWMSYDEMLKKKAEKTKSSKKTAAKKKTVKSKKTKDDQ